MRPGNVWVHEGWHCSNTGLSSTHFHFRVEILSKKHKNVQMLDVYTAKYKEEMFQFKAFLAKITSMDKQDITEAYFSLKSHKSGDISVKK